jgi:hypothetical protein
MYLSKTAAARKNARMINEAAGMVSERVKTPRLSDTSNLIREVVKERSNPGKKMLKIGTALLLMPEPITGVAAVPILVIGKALSSNRGVNVSGIYEELRKSLREISTSSSL